jgi:hypothetical protein
VPVADGGAAAGGGGGAAAVAVLLILPMVCVLWWLVFLRSMCLLSVAWGGQLSPCLQRFRWVHALML